MSDRLNVAADLNDLLDDHNLTLDEAVEIVSDLAELMAQWVEATEPDATRTIEHYRQTAYDADAMLVEVSEAIDEAIDDEVHAMEAEE